MDNTQLDTKWWLDSTIVRKALLLILSLVAQALKLFGVEFLTETQEGIIALAQLLIGAYVGITLLIDRFNVSKRTTTVVAPISITKPEETK